MPESNSGNLFLLAQVASFNNRVFKRFSYLIIKTSKRSTVAFVIAIINLERGQPTPLRQSARTSVVRIAFPSRRSLPGSITRSYLSKPRYSVHYRKSCITERKSWTKNIRESGGVWRTRVVWKMLDAPSRFVISKSRLITT